MKKYLLSALALPLLFACSSEDFDEKVISNDKFAGIEKVDATFTMGETTRMATQWGLEEGDKYGLAWMQDGLDTPILTLDGKAYQNHPLTQTNGIFMPTTSIYTGKYYLYRPYDETVVEPAVINFNSLKEQPLAEGMASSGAAWKGLAKSAIIIADKWTNVTKTGANLDGDGVMWNVAGENPKFKIYAAFFSNQTGLDLAYENNDVKFDGKKIVGATDIDYTYPTGSDIGAPKITKASVALAGAANSFTYAPTQEPVNGGDHNGEFWASKSNLNTTITGAGFTFTDEAITLKAPTGGVEATGEKGWFWFNSLPVDNAGTTTATTVDLVLNTSYGDVTVNSTVGDCAYAFEKYGTETTKSWIPFANADDAANRKWNVAAASHNTFLNQYGNHKGKYALTVDFKTAVIDGMHIESDAHLQQALKFYIASGNTNSATLNLDADANNEFRISKISIALLQTINASADKVKVQACTTHGTPKIIVTQDGQQGVTGLDGKTEVPALNKVFAVATKVYLASGTDWTWSGGGETGGWDDALTIDDKVSSITNEGTLTVNATNVQLSEAGVKIFNAKDATMNITKVTTVKNTLHNYGTLNVGDADNTAAELRAYGPKWIVNNATSLTEHGVINNYGVVGVTAGTSGQFNNYGLINMMNDNAITLLTSNEKGTNPFGATWADGNKMGTVNLPANNPTAIVSVSNTAENGFIKYTWPASTKTYATPEGNVKYNTIVVSGDIEFTEVESEIQYIEFNGVKTQVINAGSDKGKLSKLKGIIVRNEDNNASIIIEKGNTINCSVGAYLGTGATVYKGGKFTKAGAAFVAADATAANNYLGAWSLDQIVEY